MKTVFFGPFVGEFGWELLFWHGWVRRLCRTRYKDYYRIACSFPGRYPFYPEVDEFWPLPKEFLQIPISPRNYMTDYWIAGQPKADAGEALPDVWPRLLSVIEDFKKKLPEDTEFIHPWVFRYDREDRRYYGVDKDFNTYAPPYSKQVLEKLEPTQIGVEEFKKILKKDEKLIALFPRKKIFRRPDKNWQKEKYEILIKLIQKELPCYKVAILGEPDGAFFFDGVPEGCIDLINVNPNQRMDIQLAALKQSELAIGSQSGAITFALNAGCKALSWGLPKGERAFTKENYISSPLFFLPHPNPSVRLVFKYIKWLVGASPMPGDNIIRIAKIVFYRCFNPRYFYLVRSKIMLTYKLWRKKK
jgi:hypothetical protein